MGCVQAALESGDVGGARFGVKAARVALQESDWKEGMDECSQLEMLIEQRERRDGALAEGGQALKAVGVALGAGLLDEARQLVHKSRALYSDLDLGVQAREVFESISAIELQVQAAEHNQELKRRADEVAAPPAHFCIVCLFVPFGMRHWMMGAVLFVGGCRRLGRRSKRSWR